MSAAPSIAAPELSAPARETLSGWRDELAKLIKQRQQTLRRSNRQLETHLKSAIECARQSILDACAPRRAELAEEAASLIARYFTRCGDAAEAVKNFEAVRALRDFLRGPFAGSTLDALARQAEETAALIEAILAGQSPLWTFTPAPCIRQRRKSFPPPLGGIQPPASITRANQ